MWRSPCSASPGAGAPGSATDCSCAATKVSRRLCFHRLASSRQGHVPAVTRAGFPRCSCCRSVCTVRLGKGPKRWGAADPLLGWIRGTSADAAGDLPRGSAETRASEVTAMLTRRRHCQSGSGRCSVLPTGTGCTRLPQTVDAPAAVSREAGRSERAVVFIRPLALSQAACVFADALKTASAAR